MRKIKENALKYRKWVVVLLVLVPALLLGRKALAKKKKPPRGKKQKTVKVSKRDIVKTLTLSGSVRAEEDVTLRFQSSGLLNWVGVKKGDRVKKWQALASLDRRSLQKTLKKKLNLYLDERLDFEQTQDDYQDEKDRHLIDDEIQRLLDQAQAGLENSVLDVELADLAYRLAVMTSPINGIVTYIEQPFSGVNITPSTAEITVINPETVYFSAKVDEEDIASLSPSLPATLKVDAYPDEEIPSTITYISLSPLPGNSTVSYEVKLALPVDNSGLKYRIDMSGDASIPLEKSVGALAIPLKALNQKRERNYVLLKTGDKTEEVEVETGLETDRFVEILSGLDQGQEVVYYE